ncbi:MAG: HAMP domain-containing sensor histidine kinase, partial [Pirellulales bacterium]
MDRPKIYQPSLDSSAAQAPSTAPPAATPRNSFPHGQQRPAFAWVDVRALLDEVCAHFAPQTQAAGIETTLDVPEQLGILADADMLRRAISNLVANAIECMAGGGRLVITSYHGKGGLELEVADSGPGLSDDALRRAFDPYYTTKRNSAGLGLAHVRTIAQSHGGDVVVMNCPEGGPA